VQRVSQGKGLISIGKKAVFLDKGGEILYNENKAKNQGITVVF
jgi:hypothetical protein